MDWLVPKDYSTQSKAFLLKHGAEHVNYVEIVRTPISEGIKTLLNLITVGKYDKAVEASSYDKMFHLALLVETDEGHYFQFEKNQTIRLGNPSGLSDETERMKVPISKKTEIWQLLAKAEKYLGKEAYFRYSAFNNNCQVFVISILAASKISTPFVYDKRIKSSLTTEFNRSINSLSYILLRN